MHIREKIREWIKKRFIIEQLYNGKCIGCGNTDLGTLEFHHINPDIDNKLKWEALEHFDTKAIIKQLINQNCICVCSNCHSLIHSRYYEFAEEILDNFYNKDLVVQKVKLVKKHYEDIINNISNFKIEQKKINFKPLLLLEIPHTARWKFHLLKIYYFLQKSNNKLFKAYDLRAILEISIKHIYKHLNRFIEQRYIEKDSKTRGIYKFTIFGLYKIEEIEKNHKLISLKIKKQILNL